MVETAPQAGSVTDLTLDNFFSESWEQPFARRDRGNETPELQLPRVQDASVEQLLRLHYELEDERRAFSYESIHYLEADVYLALNRRLMMGLAFEYEWVEPRPGFREREGFAEALVTKLQLVDTAHSSYSFTFDAQAPNTNIGNRQSVLGFGLAGWNDLAPWGLPKTGLYYSVIEDTFCGPARSDGLRNEIVYSMALARTWNVPGPACVRDFTTFMAVSATSALDGLPKNRTNASITPGVRIDLCGHQALVLGVDLPVTSPRLYEAVYRFSYLYSF